MPGVEVVTSRRVLREGAGVARRPVGAPGPPFRAMRDNGPYGKTCSAGRISGRKPTLSGAFEAGRYSFAPPVAVADPAASAATALEQTRRLARPPGAGLQAIRSPNREGRHGGRGKAKGSLLVSLDMKRLQPLPPRRVSGSCMRPTCRGPMWLATSRPGSRSAAR